MEDALSPRSVRASASVIFLAPALRLLPVQTAAAAGPAGWLCPAAALPALLLLALLLRRAFRGGAAGAGLAETLVRAAGPVAGGGVTMLIGLWLPLYAGFILRSGADRFVGTIYPGVSPYVFVAAMLLMCLTAALGPESALGRAAQIFRPLLTAVLALVLFFAALDGEPVNLLPVTAGDAVPVLAGALPVLDVVGFALVFSALPRRQEGRAGEGMAVWTLAACAFLTALGAVTVAKFGADLTARLSQPFFVLSRNLRLFGAVERIEALVTALWVLPDFVLVSLCLRLGADFLAEALDMDPGRRSRLFSLTAGRLLVLGCAGAALAGALALPRDAVELRVISQQLIPAVSSSVFLAAVPLCLLWGLLRKKI